MQTQRASYNYSLHSQRGVATIFAVMMMLSLMTFLAVVTDTGRLYLEKRTLQKNADLAALETALLYCRDQTMDPTAMDAAALNVLSRNNFQGTSGEGGNSTVTVTQSGKAVTVNLAYTVRASLFGQLLSNGFVNLNARATAKACEPTAQLTMRSNLLNIDSSNSALLNSLLGGFLGTTLNLNVGDWQSLVDTNLNLLSYFDALATELSLDAGNYDGVLNTAISVGDLIDVAADALQTGGNTAAINALGFLSAAIPGATPLIELGDLLNIQSGTEKEALNTNLQLMQLVQGAIQLANLQSGIDASIPVNLGIANATLRIKITEPPQYSAVGNPELAKDAPYGVNEIYVRSSQIKVFTSLNLPILNTLEPLLNNSLISGVTNMANDLLSLNLLKAVGDLLCIGTCGGEIIHIKALSSNNPSESSSSRIDVLISAGEGQARVTDYDCNSTSGGKSLTSSSRSSVASVVIGKMTANNALSNDSLIVKPIPIIDIGKVTAKKSCITSLICGPASYKKGASWVSDPNNADRIAFAGGGIGISFPQEENSSDITNPPSQALTHENAPDENYLPEINQELTDNAFQSISSQGIVSDINNNVLSNINFVFYEPENSGIGGNGLGSLISLLGGTVINPLLDGVTNLLSSALAPLLDNVLNNVLDLLGASLANAEVGAALTCENDKVRLTN